MSDKAREVVRNIVSLTRELTGLEAEDEERLHRHRDFLLSLGEELVASFYDRLFAHETTASVFNAGERPAREETLVNWLRRTVSDSFGETYWMWQWFVGLIHIKRQVSNPMMLAMMSHVQQLVLQRAVEKLGAEEGLALFRSFQRVTTVIAAIIAEGYAVGSLEAVSRATGMSTELIKVHIGSAIDEELASATELIAA